MRACGSDAGHYPSHSHCYLKNNASSPWPPFFRAAVTNQAGWQETKRVTDSTDTLVPIDERERDGNNQEQPGDRNKARSKNNRRRRTTTTTARRRRIMVRPAVVITSFAALASSALLSTAHPLCFYGPDRAVSSTTESTFCPNKQPEGFCCEPLEEDLLKTKLAAAGVSPACSPLYKEVRNQHNREWRLGQRERKTGRERGLTSKALLCADLFARSVDVGCR